MIRKAVFRKLPVDFQHHAVPADLGDDARRGDRKRESVALHDRDVGMREVTRRQTVDQAVIRRRVEQFHGPTHREMGGSQDIDAIDFLVIRNGDRPGNMGVLGEDGE